MWEDIDYPPEVLCWRCEDRLRNLIGWLDYRHVGGPEDGKQMQVNEPN